MKIQKIVSGVTLSLTLLYMVFLGGEGVIVNADTATSTSAAAINDVVTLTVSTEISLTCPTSVSLGTISGLTGGTASNTSDCNVKTNAALGYNLTVNATNTPAMISDSNDISDYSTTTPQFTWAIPSTASSSFGFAVSSTDAVAAFKNDGSACGAGTTSTYANCFRAFSGASAIPVASKASATTATGVTTTLNFKTEIGSTRVQPSGTYTATVVITANAQ